MKNRVILLIAIIGMILSNSLVIQQRQVEGIFTAPLNNTNTYTVKQAELQASIGSGDYYCEGISLGSEHFAEGSIIEINFINTSTELIYYNVTLNDVKNQTWHFYEEWVEYYITSYLMLIFDVANNIYEDGNYSYLLTNGIRLEDLVKTFFLPIGNVSQIMEIIEGIPPQVEKSIATDTELDIEGKIYEQYETTNTEIAIEWLFSGSQQIETMVDFTFSNHVRIAYGKTDGELLGVKIVSELGGLFYDMDMMLSTDYLIEKEGYTIGDFSISKLAGASMPVIIISGGIILIAAVIVQKRLKKNV